MGATTCHAAQKGTAPRARKTEFTGSWMRNMGYERTYTAKGPARAEVDALPGAMVLEFGTGWCGHYSAAQPAIEAAFAAHPHVPHLKIEDGRGRPLGRSFRIKLWPTLVFLRDGQELARVVRPQDPREVATALARIDPIQGTP